MNHMLYCKYNKNRDQKNQYINWIGLPKFFWQMHDTVFYSIFSTHIFVQIYIDAIHISEYYNYKWN